MLSHQEPAQVEGLKGGMLLTVSSIVLETLKFWQPSQKVETGQPPRPLYSERGPRRQPPSLIRPRGSLCFPVSLCSLQTHPVWDMFTNGQAGFSFGKKQKYLYLSHID